LNNSLTVWFGQVTTGHGFMIIGGTLLAVLGGTTSWAAAAPMLAAGVVGLFWPENTALRTAAQATATDVSTMLAAYNSMRGKSQSGAQTGA
jgi:hypothetical protein